MKISLNWLSDYIDIRDYLAKPQELADVLTAGGIEVEGVENLAKNFDQVVVGHILKKEQHPNADRLSLCQVATGDGVVHQIVCGARNHSEGDNVVVALPGAVLPGDFAIKQSVIRGVESGGMLCSQKELGLEQTNDGILLLPKDAPVGQALAKYMGLDDILFDLKVTPNRSDCLSHFGLAREISTVLGRPTQFPIESLMESGTSTREMVQLQIQAEELCPRYCGRGIRGVKVSPSPDWLKRRLESVGMKSINNVVDVTNFVMMELGQPLHAFDVRELKGHKLIVAKSVSGEVFKTLDGTEIKFDGTELTIRDAERAVALAGVVGGLNSGIREDTTDIFIESAYFVPSTVRRASRKFGIETDSSYRFARGTNPDAVALAMNRAAQLIQKFAGGEILSAHYDHYPRPIQHQTIFIDASTLTDRLGYKVDEVEFLDWMTRLGCDAKQINEPGAVTRWAVLPPSFRWDLAVDMDLVEEYARLHGYQHIPENLPALTTMPALHERQYQLESKIRRLLQGSGCLQAINYAFVGEKYQNEILGVTAGLDEFGLRTAQRAVPIVNPLNEDLNVMRLSLLPGLVKNVMHNSRFGNPVGRLYEIGYAHFSDLPSQTQADSSVYAQESRLGFAFWGNEIDLWNKTSRAPLTFSLKGVIENLLAAMQIDAFSWEKRSAAPEQESLAPHFLHPGQSAILKIAGRAVGFVGTLHPALCNQLKIKEETGIAEINLDALAQGQPKTPKYAPISKFPEVERDLSFVLPRNLAAGEVIDEIKRVAGELLTEVFVFDVFEGGSLLPSQKSVAFRLKFRAQNATLEDAAINEVRERVVVSVQKRFAITLR